MARLLREIDDDDRFWSPKEEGDVCEGRYLRHEMGKFNELLVFETEDGMRKVSATARLWAKVKAGKIQEGQIYRLTYRGTVAIGGGKSVKDFRVQEVLDDTDPESERPVRETDERLDEAEDEVPF